MIGFNGGLIGEFRDTTPGAPSVPGVWTANEQVVARRRGLWPGPDPFFSSVSLLLPGDGTNGSTSIIDRSPSPKTITVFGNAQISTAQNKFGGSSILCDGNGDFLSTPTDSSLIMDGNFTWEAWVRIAALPTSSNFSTLWAQRSSGVAEGGPAVVVNSSGSYQLFIANSAASSWAISDASSGHSVVLNSWEHLALVKNNNQIILYKNGITGTTYSHTQTVGATGNTTIMAGAASGTQFVNGFIDDLRITKGVARYTANFTPSAGPHPTF